MTAHFPALVQAFKKKWQGKASFIGQASPPSEYSNNSAGTVFSSGALDFNSGFSGVCITQSLCFCVVLCVCLFYFGHCIV
jgi:hypothetical protein